MECISIAANRTRPRPREILIAAGHLLAMAVCLVFAAWESRAATSQFENPIALKDLDVFLASGRALTQGADPYGPAAMVTRSVGQIVIPDVNLDPPISLLLFAPLSHLDRFVVHLGWLALSLVLYLAIAALLARVYHRAVSPARIGWVLAFTPLWFTLTQGQIYLVLLPFAIGAWLALRAKRPVLAGILLGPLLAMKPNFLVWPVLLLCAGHRKTSGMAILSGGILAAIPAVLIGPWVYPAWVHGSGTIAAQRMAGFGSGDISIISIVRKLGGTVPDGVALVILVLLALAIWAYRARPDAITVTRVALPAAILAIPAGSFGYALFALPLFYDRPWSLLTRIAASLLAVPWLLILLLGQQPSVLGFIGNWTLSGAMLLLLMDQHSITTSYMPHGPHPTNTAKDREAPTIGAPPVAHSVARGEGA